MGASTSYRKITTGQLYSIITAIDNKLTSLSYLPLSGGSLTGLLTTTVIRPDTDITRDIGSSTLQYRNIYAQGILLASTGTAVRIANGANIVSFDKDGTGRNLFSLTSDNQLNIGYGIRGGIGTMMLFGTTIGLRTYNGTAQVVALNLTADGDATSLGNLLSRTTNTYNLGASNNRWNYMYANQLSVTLGVVDTRYNSGSKVFATDGSVVDMVNYPTLSDLATTLSGYVTTTSLATTLADYVTSTALSTTLADYVTSTSLTTTLSDYVTNTGLSNLLANYVLSTDLTRILTDYALASSIPTKLSDLTNDMISAWALGATKPSYAWSEITNRPTALSDFTDDVVVGNYLPLSGGTLAGVLNARNILPDTDVTRTLGSTSYRWNYLYARYVNVPNNSGYYQIVDKDGIARNILYMTNTNLLRIGYQLRSGVGSLALYGNIVQFRTYNGSSEVLAFNLTADGDANSLGNILSRVANTYNIGASNNYWLNAYIQNVIAGTSISSPLATITTNNVTNEVVSGSLAIPTTAPSTPDNNKVYLYFTEDGTYSE